MQVVPPTHGTTGAVNLTGRPRMEALERRPAVRGMEDLPRALRGGPNSLRVEAFKQEPWELPAFYVDSRVPAAVLADGPLHSCRVGRAVEPGLHPHAPSSGTPGPDRQGGLPMNCQLHLTDTRREVASGL